MVLTEKGTDAIPILIAFIGFSSKWISDFVFATKSSYTLGEIVTRHC